MTQSTRLTLSLFADSAITLDGNVVNTPLIEGRHVILPLTAGAHAVTVEAPPTTMRTIYEDTLIDNNISLNGTFPITSSNFAGGTASAACFIVSC